MDRPTYEHEKKANGEPLSTVSSDPLSFQINKQPSKQTSSVSSNSLKDPASISEISSTQKNSKAACYTLTSTKHKQTARLNTTFRTKSKSIEGTNGSLKKATSHISKSLTDMSMSKYHHSRKHSAKKNEKVINRSFVDGHKSSSAVGTRRKEYNVVHSGLSIQVSNELALSTRSMDRLTVGSSTSLSKNRESLKAAAVAYRSSSVSKKRSIQKKKQPESKLTGHCLRSTSTLEAVAKQGSDLTKTALDIKESIQIEERTKENKHENNTEKILDRNCPLHNINNSTGQPEATS